jgi:hypothetical protein
MDCETCGHSLWGWHTQRGTLLQDLWPWGAAWLNRLNHPTIS